MCLSGAEAPGPYTQLSELQGDRDPKVKAGPLRAFQMKAFCFPGFGCPTVALSRVDLKEKKR